MAMRHVVVAGSTGLIGSEVLRQLAGRADIQVTALVRKASGQSRAGNIQECVFDFNTPASFLRIGTAEIPCDALLCCIGSTMRQAGSAAAFQKIERDIPLALAARVVTLGTATLGFVSSAGAGSPTGFYLKNKAETEAGIVRSEIRHVIVRPSLLLGDRHEFRLGERLAILTLPPLMNLASALTLHRIPALGRLLPIPAAAVAKTLIRLCVDQPVSTGVIVEGYALRD